MSLSRKLITDRVQGPFLLPKKRYAGLFDKNTKSIWACFRFCASFIRGF